MKVLSVLLLQLLWTTASAVNWRSGHLPAAAAAVSVDAGNFESVRLGKYGRKFASLCSSANNDKNFRHNILQPLLRDRVSGTEGNAEVRRHIVDKMTSLKWHVTEDAFEAETPRGPRTFTNIVAVLDPGSRSRLTLACHYDSKQFDHINFIGATDSAVSCAMLIQLAICLNASLDAHATQQQLDRSLQLIFFDGEESVVDWTEADSLYGSRHLADVMERQSLGADDYVASSNAGSFQLTEADEFLPSTSTLLDAIEVLIVLDLIGTSQTQFFNWFPQTASIYRRLANIELLLAADKQPAGDLVTDSNRYFLAADSVFTAGLTSQGIQDDHVPFMNKGVPALHLISYPFPALWHTKADNETALDYATIDDISAILRVFVAEFLSLVA